MANSDSVILNLLAVLVPEGTSMWTLAIAGLLIGALLVALLRCARAGRKEEPVDNKFKKVAQWAEVVRRMVRDQQELGKAVSDQTILRFLVKDKSDSLGQDFSDCGLNESTAKKLKSNGVTTSKAGRELLKYYRRAQLKDPEADMFKRLQEARATLASWLERQGASEEVAGTMSTLVMGRAFLMLLLLVGNVKEANPEQHADSFNKWHSVYVSRKEEAADDKQD